MKTHFLLLPVLGLLFISGCNKENQRIGESTYELDSVVESYLDTLGNITFARTIPVSEEYVRNILPQLNARSGAAEITYYENNDSIVLKRMENYDTGDALYIVNNKFRRLYNEHYVTFNHEIFEIKRQVINYNNDGKLSSITSFFVDHGYGYKGGANEDWPDSGQCFTRQKNEMLFSYSGNNLSYLDYDLYEGFTDSLSQFSSHNCLFSYTNHYPNQKDMIGIDINDFTLSLVLYQWYTIFRGFSGDELQTDFYNLQLALILNKQATFNTNCDYLIEHAPFNTNDFNIGYDILGETDIQYEFDSKFNNRIKSMVLNNNHKYTFYYKD